MSLRFTIPITLASLGRGFHLVPDEEIEREPSDVPAPIDYAPLVGVGRQVVLWLVDVAHSHTTDPLDRTAIDRVQRAALSALNRVPSAFRPDVSEEDLLTVAGILLTAFEGDLAMPGLASTFASLYDATDGDLSAIEQVIAERTAVAPVSKRGPVRVVPFVVRRRPRLAHDAIDDLRMGR